MIMVLDAPVLTTARLTLSPLASTDATDLFAMRGDAETMRFRDWPADETRDRCAATIGRYLGEMARGEALYWSARFSDDDSHAGLFELNDLHSDMPGLRLMVPRPLWWQGLASEACAALIAQARARGYRALTARIHDGHHAAARLLGQFGFIETEAKRAVTVRPGVEIVCRSYTLPLRRREDAPLFGW